MGGQALYYGMNAPFPQCHHGGPEETEIGQWDVPGLHRLRQELCRQAGAYQCIPGDQGPDHCGGPDGEYAPLVRRLGGQVIEIAPDSPHHINPMDIQLDLGGDESPLSMKADFLLSLCELVVGGKEGLQPIEKTVIDRCVRLVYRELALGIGDGKPPLLQDLYEELLRQPEPEAKRVATALELYCTGSLNLFNFPPMWTSIPVWCVSCSKGWARTCGRSLCTSPTTL